VTRERRRRWTSLCAKTTRPRCGTVEKSVNHLSLEVGTALGHPGIGGGRGFWDAINRSHTCRPRHSCSFGLPAREPLREITSAASSGCIHPDDWDGLEREDAASADERRDRSPLPPVGPDGTCTGSRTRAVPYSRPTHPAARFKRARPWTSTRA